MKRNKVNGLKRTGTAAVEFALVAPLFFLFLFGIFEFGRMVMVQQQITAASRDGARLAIVQGTSAKQVVAEVKKHLAAGGIKTVDVDVSESSLGTVAHGKPVTVTVSVGFDKVSWIPAPFFLGNAQLTSSSTMRKESPQ